MLPTPFLLLLPFFHGERFEATLEPKGYSSIFFFIYPKFFSHIFHGFRSGKIKGVSGVQMFSLHEGSGLLLLLLLAGLQVM